MDRDSPPLAADPPGRRRGLVGALRDTTFRSLRHRNYRLYFAGQIVSFTGSWMQSAALMWLMFVRTGDLRWPSWLLVAQVGPTVLLGAWGGGLADRAYKPALIFGTQSAFLAISVSLAALVAADGASAWAVLALQVASGIVQAVDLPARLALVSDLVPRRDLVNAVGLNSLLFNSARCVGPAVAGLVFRLAAWDGLPMPAGADRVRAGAAACFALNAVSFVAVLLALRAIRFPGGRAPPPPGERASSWEGVRYLAAHPRLGALVPLTLAVCVFGWPVYTLLSAYTRDVLGLDAGGGAAAYSSLLSGLGAGSLAAALATATFGRNDRRGPFLVAGAIAAGLGLLGLSLAPSLPAAVAAAAGTGFGLILYLSTGQSTLQLSVPDDKRGRIMALWAMTLSASAPLGHLAAGEAAAAVGVAGVLRGMAAGVLAAAAGLALLAAVRARAGSASEPEA